jgi:hypothetical protein
LGNLFTSGHPACSFLHSECLKHRYLDRGLVVFVTDTNSRSWVRISARE